MNLLEYPFEGLIEAFQAAALDALLAVLPTALFVLTLGFLFYLVWTLSTGVLTDEPGLLRRVAKELVVYTVFFGATATSPGWLGHVPGFFEEVGQLATGLENLSVSSLFHLGVELGLEVTGLMGTLFPWVEFILLPFRLGTLLLLAVAFGLAVYRLVEIKVIFAVLLGGMGFHFGFGGNPWTWGLFAGYCRSLVKQGIELAVAYFLLGHAVAVMETWIAVARSISELTWANYVTLMIAPPAISFLIWRLPERVAGAVTASWSLQNPFAKA